MSQLWICRANKQRAESYTPISIHHVVWKMSFMWFNCGTFRIHSFHSLSLLFTNENDMQYTCTVSAIIYPFLINKPSPLVIQSGNKHPFYFKDRRVVYMSWKYIKRVLVNRQMESWHFVTICIWQHAYFGHLSSFLNHKGLDRAFTEYLLIYF